MFFPRGLYDLCREAENQKNCLLGYVRKLVDKNDATVILFLREKSNPSKSYITLEIDDKKKLIYSTMNKANCTGGNINITQSYAICNGKCFNNETDKDYSYTCKKTSSSYISYKKIIIVFLMMIFY